MNVNYTQIVLDAHMANPQLTASDIAEIVKISPSTVRAIVSRMRIALPSEHAKKMRQRLAAMPPKRRFRKIPYAGKAGNAEW